jgi:hypothetical protein
VPTKPPPHEDGDKDTPQADETLSDIASALSGIECEAEGFRKSCRRKKRWFRVAHYTVGGAAAVLAAAASVSALQDLASAAVAILAGLAAVVSAVQLFLRPAENATLHLGREVAWDELAKSIDDLLALDLRSLEDDDARQELRKYRERFFALRRGEPGPQ